MDVTYIELLLVEQENGVKELVTAPTSEAFEGSLVFYDGCKMGTVIAKKWVEVGSEIHTILQAACKLYPAESIYLPKWSKEDLNAQTD